ncbi:MAG: MerR family transcriptional regulator [Myxococcota bacterium]|nr:MerR family transcriptional regulator [Myxococcota bacterium]
MHDDDAPYGIEELADRAGVSRRTVRYYVQRGLLPAPTGVGRGKHYTEAHLARLVRVRELQEEGVSLDAIADRLEGRTPAPRVPEDDAIVQSTWTRIALSRDVELMVRGRRLDEAEVRRVVAAVERAMRPRSGEGER